MFDTQQYKPDLYGQYFVCQAGFKVMMVGPLAPRLSNVELETIAADRFSERHGQQPDTISRC